MKKKILLTILAILVIIQFIRPERNQSKVPSANDITRHYTVPQNVQTIFQRSCNDCHSNNTEYPWYTNIQPVGWWLQHHVKEGKRSLNFNEFASYTPGDQRHSLEELVEEVKENHMPLNSYLWMHGDAKLSDTDKKLIADWAEAVRREIGYKHGIK